MSWSEELSASRRRQDDARAASEAVARQRKAQEEVEREWRQDFERLTNEFLSRARTCPRHTRALHRGIPLRLWMVNVTGIVNERDSWTYHGIYLSSRGGWWRSYLGSDPEAPRWASQYLEKWTAPTPTSRSDEASAREDIKQWQRRYADALTRYGYTGS